MARQKTSRRAALTKTMTKTKQAAPRRPASVPASSPPPSLAAMVQPRQTTPDLSPIEPTRVVFSRLSLPTYITLDSRARTLGLTTDEVVAEAVEAYLKPIAPKAFWKRWIGAA